MRTSQITIGANPLDVVHRYNGVRLASAIFSIFVLILTLNVSAGVNIPVYNFAAYPRASQNGWSFEGSITLKSAASSTPQLLAKSDIQSLNLTISNPASPTGTVKFGLADLLLWDGVMYDQNSIYVPVGNFNRFILKTDNGIAPWEQTDWITQKFSGQFLSRCSSYRFNQDGTTATNRWFEETVRASDYQLTIAVVPEPSSVTLLVLGGLGLMALRRLNT